MTAAEDLIGRTLQGKFVITDVLGEGAMGIVYRGFDGATLDEVAIKVLQPSLAQHDELVARFHREAAATRRVDHEGTVRVLGRGSDGGVHYLVMELLHGRSLGAVLAEARHLPEGRAARIVVQLCGALAVAHARGVVHRDIKPDNIMILPDIDHLGERVKLLDFGVAKRVAAADARVEDSFNSGDETRHGALIGTPEYMAPEQCMGREVDQRTDVYACGVLLYRMLTGEVPFDGTGAHPFELCQRHIAEDPRPPREIAPWIGAPMEAVVLKAMSKSPDARHQSAGELRDEIARVLASIEAMEMEPTTPLLVSDLIRPDERADLDAGPEASLVEAAEAEPRTSTPSSAGATPAPPAEAEPISQAFHPVPVPLAVQEVVSAPLGFVAMPQSPRHPVVPGPIVDRPTPIPFTRSRRLQGYLPSVALAAVIGAGLGSLLMALIPLIQR
jgi:serine/threonine-protein kinase